MSDFVKFSDSFLPYQDLFTNTRHTNHQEMVDSRG
jgi:hypothetical protein